MNIRRILNVWRLDRPLLVTFDANGTLYRPRAPVPLLYDAVAKEHGMFVQGPQQLDQEFKKALAENMSLFPNYGKNIFDSPEKWWQMVVNKTFEGCAAPGQKVPQFLAPDLFKRFSGRAVYQCIESVAPTIRALREIEADSDFPVIIGVITNSDPRVATILRSLGFTVGDDEPMRNMAPDVKPFDSSMLEPEPEQRRQPPLIDRTKRPNFDFVLASYDAEFQKPQRQIFGLAERYAVDMMRRLPAPATHNSLYPWPYPFARLHVGDNIIKDAVAATEAGWNALVYKDRESMNELSLKERDGLGPGKMPHHIDLKHGVMMVIKEWCEVQAVQVETREDSEKGLKKPVEKKHKKLSSSDPASLAAEYERTAAELMRQSTPQECDVIQKHYTAPPALREKSLETKDTTARPSSSSPSSRSSLKSKRADIMANSDEWRTMGIAKNLTNTTTSYLRPSELQKMRRRRNDDSAAPPSATEPFLNPHQQHQKITRSLAERQERALQRRRSRLLKRLPEVQSTPIKVPDSVIDEWERQKRTSAEIEKMEKETHQRERGFFRWSSAQMRSTSGSSRSG